MKRNLLRIIMFAALVVGVLAGCQDDIGKAAVEGGVGREGRRLKSEISVVPMQNDTPTKSLYGGDESVVNNWALLQFDGVTEKLVAKYYQESDANIGNIKVVAGHPYYWFAVANLGDVRSQFSIGTTTTAGMASWYATGIDMSTASGLPMSWASSGTVAFTKEQISGGATLDVDMTRMVAKYNVVLDKSGLSVFTFTGATGHQGASIMGPGSVKAFAESNATDVAATVSSTDGFSSMDIARFYGGNQAVVLYAAENMYGNIESIDTPAKKKASNVGTRKPTYVQVYGQASGDGYENVPLTYRFYLGQNATSNFDVIRNTVSTVTLKLTDDAIRSAIAVANNDPDDPYYPDDPDIWKIESQPVSDTRVLMFNDGVQNGGTGSLSLTLGERTAEALVRTPADLAYQFKMDAALYSAGFRAYTDAAGTTEVDSGYGSDYVTVTGAPGTLYFYAPTGISPTTGKVYVKTTDGRKSDELTLTAGRVFDHLEVSFANINSSSNAVSGNFGEWQSADVDKYLYQIMNASSALGAGYGLKIRAVYSDGTTSALEGAGGSNSANPCDFSYNTATNLASGASGGYGTGATRFFQNVTASGETEYRLVRFKYSGTQTETISYTENGVTDNIKIKVTAHVGSLTAEPVSTSSSRISVPLNGSADVKYYWEDNNESVIGDAAKVDVTAKTASHITIASGGTCLQYDGLVGGAARFSGKGVTGTAQANVGSASDYGFINYKDIAEGFGESRDGARDVNIPTSAVQSNTGYHPFSRSYFEVVDNRVLDHITIVPSRIYAPGVSTSSDETVNYKVYAYFEGDATPVDITTSSDLTVTPMTYYNSTFPYPQWYLEDPSSNMGWRLVTMRDIPTVSGEYLQAKYRKTSHNSSVTGRTAITTNTDSNTPYFTVSYTFGGKTCTDSVKPSLEDTRTVVALNVTPNPVSLYEGQSQQFTATAVYDTGDEVNVTTTATWNNDANGKLTNNGGGSYTGLSAGTTTVTATYSGVSGSANVTVSERTVSSFILQMKNPSTGAWETSAQTVNLGSDQQWRLMVTYADSATPEAVTSGFNLTTSDSGVISVSGTGSHAEAVGTSNIGATYKGKTSTNTVKVTVQSHEYSYELLVTDSSFPNSAEGYAAAVSNYNSTTDLDWDETQGFYAYYVRKDHGIFDQMTDVSGDASWTIDSDLTASNVGSWNGGSQIYTANNTSGASVDGNLTAEYSGKSSYKTINVGYYVEPALSVSPDELEWAWDEYGTSDRLSVTVSATNTAWSVKSISDHWSYTRSGNTIYVYPDSQNTTDAIITGTLVIEGTNGVSDVTVDLTHWAWNHQSGHIQYRLEDVYIAKPGALTTPVTSDTVAGDGDEDYVFVAHYQVKVGTGAWTDEYETITSADLEWGLSSTQYAGLTDNEVLHENVTVVNRNTTTSDKTTTLTATIPVGTIHTHVTSPVNVSFAIGRDGASASATITLEPCQSDVYEYRVVITPSDMQILDDDGTVVLTAKLQERVNNGAWTDVTTNAGDWSWSSGNTSVASISPASGKSTTVTGHNGDSGTSYKETDVTATYNGTQRGESVSESESVTIRVNDQTPVVTHTYKLVIEASPTSLETGESTTLSAILYDSTDDGNTWDGGTDVTSSTTFSKYSGSATVNISENIATGTTAGTAVFTGEYSSVTVTTTVNSDTVTWTDPATPKTPVSLEIIMGDLFHGDSYHTATSGVPSGIVRYSDNTTKDLSADDFDSYKVKGAFQLGGGTDYAAGESINGADYNVGEARISGSYTENGVTVSANSTFDIIGWYLDDLNSISGDDENEVGFGNSVEVGFKAIYQVYPGGSYETRIVEPTQISGLSGLPSGITYSDVAGVIRFVVNANTATGTYSITARYADPENTSNVKSTTFTLTVSTTGYTVDVDSVN